MADADESWAEVAARLVAGDRLAFLKVNRLVTGCLTQLRAYDFQDEWDDLRQEVVLAVIANLRAGRLNDSQAFVGYVRIITRNKVMDRLRIRLQHHEGETVAWDDATAAAATAPAPEEQIDHATVRAALAELSTDERRVIEGVYGQGRTYEEVSAETGIPLGTMKRRLREALQVLRRRLAPG